MPDFPRLFEQLSALRVRAARWLEQHGPLLESTDGVPERLLDHLELREDQISSPAFD